MDAWIGGWGFEPEILGLVEKANVSPDLSEVPQLVGNMAPPAVPQNLPVKTGLMPVNIAGGEFLRPHEVQMLNGNGPLSLFSQQEMDDAAVALSASLNPGQQLPLDLGGGIDMMAAGFDGGGLVGGVDGLPVQEFGMGGVDMIVLGTEMGMGTDVVDWAQFAT